MMSQKLGIHEISIMGLFIHSNDNPWDRYHGFVIAKLPYWKCITLCITCVRRGFWECARDFMKTIKLLRGFGNVDS